MATRLWGKGGVCGAPCVFTCEGKRHGGGVDPVSQHLAVQLGSLRGIWLLQSWEPLRVEDCWERMRSTRLSGARASLPTGWKTWRKEL